jgi:hypothetical protein
MIEADVRRMSAQDRDEVAAYFASGPGEPCIFPDATEQWQAAKTWTFERFSRDFGNDFGFVNLSFHGDKGGRSTKLGTFLENLGKPVHEIPGFWLDANLESSREAPEYDEDAVWSFSWNPFKAHPELLGEVSPFPFASHNFVTTLPPDLLGLTQAISRTDLHSIYISRKGTVTPLHQDFHRTIGCLVQFVGAKRVVLIAPDDYKKCEGEPLDPARPDYDRFPEMRGRKAYTAVLIPGEMLIIPPDWWHYTCGLDPTMTLSHNFFNRTNIADFARGLLSDIRQMEDPGRLVRLIEKHIGNPGKA